MGNTDQVQDEFAESDGQEISISMAIYANEPEVDSESGTEDATTGLPPEQSDDAAAAKSYVPAHALSAGATYNVLLMAALPKDQTNIDVYKELVKVQSSWDKIKRTDDDACRFDVSVLLGISPVMKRNARETSRGRQNGTSLLTSHTPLLIFVNPPESLLPNSRRSVRDFSCSMLSGIGPA